MIIDPIYLWGILCSRDSVYLLYLNYISYARVIMKKFRFGSLTPDLLTQHLMSETSINFIRNWLVWSLGPRVWESIMLYMRGYIYRMQECIVWSCPSVSFEYFCVLTKLDIIITLNKKSWHFFGINVIII